MVRDERAHPDANEYRTGLDEYDEDPLGNRPPRAKDVPLQALTMSPVNVVNECISK